MGRKKHQKQKKESTQEQQAQPDESQRPRPGSSQHTSGPSEEPAATKKHDEMKTARAEKPAEQQRQTQQPTSSSQPHLQQEPRRQQQIHGRGRGRGKIQQPQEAVGFQQAPFYQQLQGNVWKGDAPLSRQEFFQKQQPSTLTTLQSPQQQQRVSHGEAKGFQQSTPSPQLYKESEPREHQQQVYGRGRGKSRQEQQQPGYSSWHRESPHPQQPQPGHGAWQGRSPHPQQQQQRQQQLRQQVKGLLESHREPQSGSSQAVQLKEQKESQKRQIHSLPQQRPLPVQQTSTEVPQHKERGTPEEPQSSLDLAIPQRKKLNSAGTSGRKIHIETNHLALTFRNLNSAVHYDVEIEPNIPKRLLRMVMEEFRLANYPQRYPAFDGRKNLYSSSYLPFGDYISGEVTVMEDDRSRGFKVTVKFATMVDLSSLSTYFEILLNYQRCIIHTYYHGITPSVTFNERSKQTKAHQNLFTNVLLQRAAERDEYMVNPQEAIQCIDVVLRSAPALRCISVGRSFFTKPERRIDLGEGMEMFHGFYQSAVLGWKPFLNVDVSHKAFPKSLPIIDLISELCGCDLSTRLEDRNFITVDKLLRTLKIQYEIPNHPASRRVMRVNELDKDAANEARFQTDSGEEMTVEQYFLSKKGYRLKYPHMPCLWVGNRTRKPRMLYPVELCTLLEGQVTNHPMTSKQTAAMIKKTATSTAERKSKIMNLINTACYSKNSSAQEFGIFVDDNFTQVTARILNPPSLHYAHKDITPRKGVWLADRFKSGISLQKWCIVCLDNRTQMDMIRKFADTMIREGKQLGMDIGQSYLVSSIQLKYQTARTTLEQEFKKYKEKGATLILVIIQNENKEMYNFVKQAAELRVGALTQCVRARNIFKLQQATVRNILLKINAKLNGVNHILKTPPKCLKVPCMVMGADVTHPSPENKKTVPSVAAVTASHDPNAFQYNICWRLQPPAKEIIADLANIVKDQLKFYINKNKRKPEKIIFYRDGVSEGEFQKVLNAEVHAIRQACKMLQADGSYQPKITFLVVQKRHHTRFFPTDSRDSDDSHRNMNVPAGTVVDTDITHPTALDFYLVSHASIQGVARPTKYHILWDDNDMTEDEVEELTYHLCHMFTRCTRSVSYPAPTYYAHLAAARAKVYCEKRRIDLDNLEKEQEQLVIKPEIIQDLPMFFV